MVSYVFTHHPVLNMSPWRRKPLQGLLLALSPIAKVIDAIGLYEPLHRVFNRFFPLSNLHRPAFGDYQAEASDIFVATYPKSGTNWMLQIIHLLMSGGTDDYEHIHDVVPWPDSEGLPAIPLGDSRTLIKGHRLIKTHLAWDAVPYHPQAKYISIIRDPKDVLVSTHPFVKSIAFGPMMPSVNTWYKLFTKGPFIFGSWEEHITSYWQARETPNLLILTYEAMKADIDAVIREVAAFIDIPLTDDLLETVKKKSSFDYMRTHDKKFYPGPALPFSPGNGSTMRTGQSGGAKKVFSTEQRNHIDATMQANLVALNCDFPYGQYLRQ